ncbi:MAG: glycosyltransferase family 2 protein [Anaerolineae bacterium]|nr:glycosyltransferase family 2 protein [Anaerolineae bacterium]
MNQVVVAVVVLAYNNYPDTAECLESVVKLAYPSLRIYLVDNGSTDGTADLVSHGFPVVSVIQTGTNLGVAGGFNAGIVPALRDGADYVFILNNDTAVPSDLIDVLVRAALTDPSYGVLMPKVLYYGERDRVWSAGARYRRFPPAIVMRGRNRPNGGPRDVPTDLEYAPSCGLLISRQAFSRAGLFDDGYFFYFDDWDFSVRVREAGLRIRYVPEASFLHKVSRTIGNRGRRPFFWRTWGESGARFYRRFGRPVWFSALANLGYLVIREGLGSSPLGAFYLLQGIVVGFRKPLASPPMLPEGVDLDE